MCRPIIKHKVDCWLIWSLSDAVRWWQDGYGDLELKEEEMKQLLLTAEDLMSKCTEENAAELTSRFERLAKQLLDLRAKADKHKVCHMCIMFWCLITTQWRTWLQTAILSTHSFIFAQHFHSLLWLLCKKMWSLHVTFICILSCLGNKKVIRPAKYSTNRTVPKVHFADLPWPGVAYEKLVF